MKRRLWHIKIILIPMIILAILFVVLPYHTFHLYPKITATYIYLGILGFISFLRSKDYWPFPAGKRFDQSATIVIWVIAIPTFVIIGLVSILVVLIFPKLIYRVIFLLSASYVFVFGIRFKKYGILPRQRFLAIINHCSTVDDIINPLIMGFRKWKVIFSPEIKRIPLVGFALKYIGIPLVRSEKSSRIDSLRKIKHYLSLDYNVLVFPEGRRLPVEKKDEMLFGFQEGVFYWSKSTGIPILPVVTYWTFLFKPRSGQWWFSPRTIRVFYLKPMRAEEEETVEDFMLRVRNSMLEKLKSLREKSNREIIN